MRAWISGDTATAQAALNRYIDWTPAAAAALQESVLGGDLFTACATTENVSCTVIINSTNDIIALCMCISRIFCSPGKSNFLR